MRLGSFVLLCAGALLIGGSIADPSLRAIGIVAAALGGLGLAADAGLRRWLARAGLRSSNVNALRGALRSGEQRAQLALDAIRKGLPGTATVLGVGDSLGTFNGRAELDLELEIHIDGRAPYKVKQRHLVPAVHVSRLRAGEVLRVRVDPQVQDRLLIDWAVA